jgi:hypothetical protein
MGTGEGDKREKWYTWGTGELYRGFLWGKLMERDDLEGLGVDERLILKWIFKNRNGTWTRLIWLRIGAGDGCL